MQVFMSVANLAPRLRDEDDQVHYLGILNRRALEDGLRIFSALGGAVELTDQGREILCALAHVEFTEHGNDARFVLDERMVGRVEGLFHQLDPELFETSPDREVREELGTCEFPGQTEPILDAKSLEQLRSRFVTLHMQGCSGMMTSRRSPKPGMRSYRLFLLHELLAPRTVIERLRQSPYLRFFTPAQVVRTQGGLTDAALPDGSTLGSNIFIFEKA